MTKFPHKKFCQNVMMIEEKENSDESKSITPSSFNNS